MNAVTDKELDAFYGVENTHDTRKLSQMDAKDAKVDASVVTDALAAAEGLVSVRVLFDVVGGEGLGP